VQEHATMHIVCSLVHHFTSSPTYSGPEWGGPPGPRPTSPSALYWWLARGPAHIQYVGELLKMVY
jgi:hypothetical protein